MGVIGFQQPVFRLLWSGFALIFGVLCFAGCGGSQASYAGTYVAERTGGAKEVYDTILVSRSAGNVFLLYRSTRFQISDEDKGAREWKLQRESWTADLDATSGLLVERRYGKRISFDVESGEMRVSSRRYKKIK